MDSLYKTVIFLASTFKIIAKLSSIIIGNTQQKIGKERKGKKERKRKDRYTKSQAGYISALWGADLVGPISTKIGKVVGVHDVIISSKFGFNILGVSYVHGINIISTTTIN